VALIMGAILRANVIFLDIAYKPQARSGLWSLLSDLMLTLIVIAPICAADRYSRDEPGW
jgi:hypothetical protein